MKKSLILLAASLFALLPAPAQTVTVTSPNGGESMAQNSKWVIKWTATGVSQGFKIVLLKAGGAPFGVIVAELPPGTASYLWAAGQTSNGMAPANQQYKVRVITVDGGTLDASNATFTITPEATVKLISPNGGENWTKFARKFITWEAEHFAGTVQLDLWWEEGYIGTITDTAPAAAGKFEWEVGKIKWGEKETSGVGHKFRISVRAGVDPFPTDKSDNFFSIGFPRQTEPTPISGK
jgi:hypothetical protein